MVGSKDVVVLRMKHVPSYVNFDIFAVQVVRRGRA